MPAADALASDALAGLADHPHARAVLTPALSRRPSHAYLFHGPGGTGKRAVARAFAAALLAEGAADPAEAAGRVQRGAHPDLTWVTPSGAAEMLVSDIEEPVVAGASRTPFESRRRVFVIERADALNEQAANRLLKTLEEPPAYAHLILVTDRPADLLETIVSRCQGVRFDPLPAARIAQQLELRGVDAGEAQACARLALGDLARALALALGDGPAVRASAEAFARAAAAGELSREPWRAPLERATALGERAEAAVLTAFASERDLYAERERRAREREAGERAKRARRRAQTEALDEVLRLAGLWFRDLLAVAVGAEELAHNVDRLDDLRSGAAAVRPQRLRAAVAAVDDTRRSLRLNVSQDLACEALAYRLARELLS